MLIGSCSGEFLGLGRERGDLRWHYDTTRDGPVASFHGDVLVTREDDLGAAPSAAGDLVVVGCDVPGGDEGEPPDGHVYAFELPDGTLRWKHAVPGGVVSAIVRRGPRVYGVSKGGALLCLDLADGELRWRLDPAPEGDLLSLRYSALVRDDVVVFSSRGGRIYAADAARGFVLWDAELGAEVSTELLLDGPRLYVGDRDGRLTWLDVDSGRILGRMDLGGEPYGRMPAIGGSLIVLADGPGLARVEPDSGLVVWSRPADPPWSSFRPAIREGAVWVGSRSGDLVGFDLETGAGRDASWRVEGPRAVDLVVRGFAFAGDRLYLGTLGGMLHCLAAPPTRGAELR